MNAKNGSPRFNPMLTHVGINVVDVDRMADFYTRVMGMTVSDRGLSERLQCNFVFMTHDPSAHHQVILVEGRPKDAVSTVNQISFLVGSLDELRVANEQIKSEGIETRPIDHGNAWSVYFPDPEDNLVEVYLDSPFHVRQPHGVPLDLSLTNEDIIRATQERIAGGDDFMSRDQWSARMADRIAGSSSSGDSLA